MIADALAGRSDYFAPMWGEAAVEASVSVLVVVLQEYDFLPNRMPWKKCCLVGRA